MRDPFDVSQYKTSFGLNENYAPNPFSFADFTESFALVAEQIRIRQACIHVGFGVPLDLFTNVEAYDVSTPASLTAGVELFQDAVIELVEGTIVDQYAKLPGCGLFVGFYTFTSNGLPILGEGSIAPGGVFTPPPNPDDITDIIDFAKAIGERLNDIIFALNNLSFIHGKMVYEYPFDDSCGDDSSPGTTGISSSPGSSPGSSVGSSVGSSPGSSVGSTPGTGSSPGSSVGSSPNSSVGSSPNSSVGSSPGSSPNSSPGSSGGSTPSTGTSAGSSPGSSPGSTPGTGSSPGSSSGSPPPTSPGSSYASSYGSPPVSPVGPVSPIFVGPGVAPVV